MAVIRAPVAYFLILVALGGQLVQSVFHEKFTPGWEQRWKHSTAADYGGTFKAIKAPGTNEMAVQVMQHCYVWERCIDDTKIPECTGPVHCFNGLPQVADMQAKLAIVGVGAYGFVQCV
jgi:hypothetical protein